MTARNNYNFLLASTNPLSAVEETPLVPAVRITVPSDETIQENAEQTYWGVIFEWNDHVDFSLSDLTATGCSLNAIDGEGDSFVVTVIIPVNSIGTAQLTVNAESVLGSEATGPAEATSASFEYNTAAENTVASGQLCEIEFNNDGFRNILGLTTASFLGPLDAVKHGDFIYAVIQVQNRSSLRFESVSDSRSKQGSAILYRIDLSQNPCVWTILKTYKSVTLAARSLCVHKNRVYFLEGSHYAYLNEGLAHSITEDGSNDNYQHFIRRLDGVDPDWKNQIGRLMSVSNLSTTLTDHGINWVSANPQDNPAWDGTDPTDVNKDVDIVIINDIYYSVENKDGITQITKVDEPPDKHYGIHGGTASPLVSDGNNLFMITGYGNLLRAVDLREESDDLNASDTARYHNWHSIKFGYNHEFTSYHLKTNDRTYHDVFTEFANETYSTFCFQNDTFCFRPRDPRHVIVNQFELEDTDTSQIIIDKHNYEISSYPASGNICINKEVLSYTTLDAARLIISGLTRGLYDSVATDHHQNDRIYWIDHIIQLNSDTIEKIIQNINLENDISNIKNYITINYGENEQELFKDDDSIDRYGKRELSIDTSINRNEKDHIKWLGNKYLYRYANIHNILNIDIGFAPYLHVGDCVYFQCKHRMHLENACQVLEIEHKLHDATTTLKVVTL